MSINNLYLKKGYSIKIKNIKNEMKTFLIKDANHIFEFPQKSINSIFQTFTKADQNQVSIDLMRTTLYINQKLYKIESQDQSIEHFSNFTKYLLRNNIYNHYLFAFFASYFHQGGLLSGWVTFFMEYLTFKTQTTFLRQKESINMLDFIDDKTFLYTSFCGCGLFDPNNLCYLNSNDLAIAFQCKVKVNSFENIEITNSTIGIANFDNKNSFDKKLLQELKYVLQNTSQILKKTKKNTLIIKEEETIWRKYLGTKAF